MSMTSSVRKRIWIGLAAFGLSLAGAAPGVSGVAEAKLFELTAQLDLGAAGGKGTADYDTDTDFFAVQKGGTFGGELSAEVLFIELTVAHHQFFSDEMKGTWTDLLLGTDFDVGLSDNVTATVGVAFGIGIGTLKAVDPPLDKEQVETKGAVAQVSLDLDYKLAPLWSAGVSVPVNYHYLFAGGEPANDPASRSQGMHWMALATTKLSFGF